MGTTPRFYCSSVRRKRINYLISTFAPASSSFFFMVSESALLTRFLDGAGHAFDQVLRFLQAQAREFANDLDDADLLVGRVFLEGDRELGLLLAGAAAAAAAAPPASSTRPGRRR